MGAPFIITHGFQIQIPEKIIFVNVIMVIAQVIAPVKTDHFPKIVVLTGIRWGIVLLDHQHIRASRCCQHFDLLPKAPARIYGAASVSSLYLPVKGPAV